MAGLYRFDTWVYEDGTVSEGKSIEGKRLLFSFTTSMRDHGYDSSSHLESVCFTAGVSGEQLKKCLDYPSLDAEAKRFLAERIKQNDFSDFE